MVSDSAEPDGDGTGLQDRLGHVAAELEAGRFTRASLRRLASAVEDVGGARAATEAAVRHPGNVPPAELHALGAEVRRWRIEP